MPAHLEKNIGSIAYDYCSKKRGKARFILSLSTLCFILYSMIPIRIWPLDAQLFENNFIISTLVSLILLIPGTIVFILGRKALGKESEAPKSYRRVIETGIYSKIRHPQLLGEMLFLLFFAVLFNQFFLIAFTILFWIPNYLAWCYFEEKDLVLRFGDDYIQYQKRTKKLLPGIF